MNRPTNRPMNRPLLPPFEVRREISLRFFGGTDVPPLVVSRCLIRGGKNVARCFGFDMVLIACISICRRIVKTIVYT